MTEGRSKGKQSTTGRQNKERMSRRKGEKGKRLNLETGREREERDRSGEKTTVSDQEILGILCKSMKVSYQLICGKSMWTDNMKMERVSVC